MTKEDFIKKFSSQLSSEVIRIASDVYTDYGADITDQLIGETISSMLHICLFKVLADSANAARKMKLNPMESHKLATKDFTDIKAQMQEAVAIGFERAAKEFSGVQINYYCTIKAVGAPANKLPC